MKPYGMRRFPAHGMAGRGQCRCGDCHTDQRLEADHKSRKKRARRQGKKEVKHEQDIREAKDASSS